MEANHFCRGDMFVFNKWLNYYGEVFAGSSVQGVMATFSIFHPLAIPQRCFQLMGFGAVSRLGFCLSVSLRVQTLRAGRLASISTKSFTDIRLDIIYLNADMKENSVQIEVYQQFAFAGQTSHFHNQNALCVLNREKEKLEIVPPTECKIEPAQSFCLFYCWVLLIAMPWANVVPLWEPKIVLNFYFELPTLDVKHISIKV